MEENKNRIKEELAKKRTDMKRWGSSILRIFKYDSLTNI